MSYEINRADLQNLCFGQECLSIPLDVDHVFVPLAGLSLFPIPYSLFPIPYSLHLVDKIN